MRREEASCYKTVVEEKLRRILRHISQCRVKLKTKVPMVIFMLVAFKSITMKRMGFDLRRVKRKRST
jgi:hypothetical protein